MQEMTKKHAERCRDSDLMMIEILKLRGYPWQKERERVLFYDGIVKGYDLATEEYSDSSPSSPFEDTILFNIAPVMERILIGLNVYDVEEDEKGHKAWKIKGKKYKLKIEEVTNGRRA
jgi:hypothetical protein